MRDDTFWDTPVQEPLVPRAGRRTRGTRAATKVERLETRGRARALQALYAADLRDRVLKMLPARRLPPSRSMPMWL
jgi:N utilization substance protein B